MIQVNETTRVGIPMRRGQDTPAAQLEGLLLAQIIPIFGVQYAVGECLAGADAEEVAREAGAVAVDIIQGRAFRGRHARTHGPHGEAHTFVRVDEVGEDLGRRGHGDASFVPEFVESALHAQVRKPVLAVLLQYPSAIHILRFESLIACVGLK